MPIRASLQAPLMQTASGLLMPLSQNYRQMARRYPLQRISVALKRKAAPGLLSTQRTMFISPATPVPLISLKRTLFGLSLVESATVFWRNLIRPETYSFFRHLSEAWRLIPLLVWLSTTQETLTSPVSHIQRIFRPRTLSKRRTPGHQIPLLRS